MDRFHRTDETPRNIIGKCATNLLNDVFKRCLVKTDVKLVTVRLLLGMFERTVWCCSEFWSTDSEVENERTKAAAQVISDEYQKIGPLRYSCLHCTHAHIHAVHNDVHTMCVHVHVHAYIVSVCMHRLCVHMHAYSVCAGACTYCTSACIQCVHVHAYTVCAYTCTLTLFVHVHMYTV